MTDGPSVSVDSQTRMNYRIATTEDAPALALLNHALIRDEGHRNAMTVSELTKRMADWLAGEYEAVVFEDGERLIGYALYRHEPDHTYVRQFFVALELRRRGVGRAALAWLREHIWGMNRRIRLDVLVGNGTGIAFWRAVGFKDYCLALELEAGTP